MSRNSATYLIFVALLSLNVLVTGNSFAQEADSVSKFTQRRNLKTLLEKSDHLKPSGIARRAADEDDINPDLSGYSVRFERCQVVKRYSEEVAQEGYDVFALNYFVVFRMCPSDSCDSCNENYGEYVSEVGDYLEAMTDQHKEQFEEFCEECEENCGDDDNKNSDDCTNCKTECDFYENMEDNGYLDATEYMECQQLQNGDVDDGDDGDSGDSGEDDNDDSLNLYIGPMCSMDSKSGESRIVIGVFSDQYCVEPYDVDVEQILGYKLSYQLMMSGYSGSSCVSCKEENDDESEDEDEARALEFCETVYDTSAKCETKHGFTEGLAAVNGYENQIENEYDVCTFVDSLVWDSYDTMGDINAYEEQDVYDRQVTRRQITALVSLGFISIGLFAYINVLHKAVPKLDLACQGDLNSQASADGVMT